MEARIKTKPKSSEWAPAGGHQPRQTSEPAVRRRDVRAGEKMEKPRGAHTGTWGPKPALSGATWSGRGSCKVGPVGAAVGRAQAPPGAATWGSAPMCFVCARVFYRPLSVGTPAVQPRVAALDAAQGTRVRL